MAAHSMVHMVSGRSDYIAARPCGRAGGAGQLDDGWNCW